MCGRNRAARGAGNADLRREGPESDASRRRRALAACRDNGLRSRSGVTDTKLCAAKVIAGDYDFILKILDAPATR